MSLSAATKEHVSATAMQMKHGVYCWNPKKMLETLMSTV